MKNFDNICRALEYIDSHLNEPIDFEKLADIFHFSPYYFHRMFSMITGKTIAAHIRDRRLEKACVELSATERTALEICLDCGFNSPPAFSRAFKNKYRLSPNEYRKQKYIPTVISVEEMIARFEKQLEGSKSMSDNIINDIEALTKKILLEPESSELYNKRGELYHALKKHEDAKTNFICAVEIEPANPLYLMNVGNTCMWLNDHAEAVKYHTTAIELSSEIAWYYNCRGTSYQWLKEYEKSLEDYTKAVELDPTNATYYYDRSTTFLWLNRYDEAIQDRTKAIELASDNALYYYERGLTYHYNLCSYEKAVEDYTHAIELDPANAVYYCERGWSFTHTGKQDKALEDYNKAIELDPTNSFLRKARGQSFDYAHRYDEAVLDYTKAIELSPEYAYYYNLRGKAYRELKEYGKAIEDFAKAVELEPSNPVFCNWRGNTYEWMGKYDESVQDYTRAIELSPETAYYYNNRGRSYRGLNEFDKSTEDFTKAIELDESAADFYKERGKNLCSAKKYGEALKDYYKAIELDSQNSEFYIELGNLFIEMDNYPEAIASRTKAIENNLDQTNTVYYYHRGILYLIHKEYEKALDDFITAIELEPENSMYYLYRLICLKWTDEINEAIKKHSEKIESRDFYYRGVCYHLLSEYEKSVADFKKAMETDPNNVKAFNYLTRISRNIKILLGKKFLESSDCEEFLNKRFVAKIKELRAEYKENFDVEIPLITIADSIHISESEITIAVDGVTVWRRDGLLNESVDRRVKEIANVIADLFA